MKRERRQLTEAELASITSRRARRRRRTRSSQVDMRELASAFFEEKLSGGVLRDLLSVALLLSLTGEVASVFAGETVLVVVFFFSTMFLCLAAWRAEAST